MFGFAFDWRFLPEASTLDPASAYVGAYDVGLVTLSVAIAILAAFVAFSISGRMVAATTSRARWAWATAGAISMGGGIWSMHFIGMLAFSLPCGITYNPFGTVLSMIPGVLASGVALAVISRPTEPGLSRLLSGAVLMGAGIGAMHYSGMAAMRPEALLLYDPWLVAASIAVAIVLAFAALSVRFRVGLLHAAPLVARIVAATIMGCAVAGMHYTAMEASIFFPLANAPIYSMAMSPTLLAMLIAVFTMLIAFSTLVASFAGRQNELAMSLRAEMSRRELIEQDLVRAREQAETANRAKSQFVATMSHEIRTPMNGVLGMANLLTSTPLNDRQQQLVDNLSRSGKALLATINDILDFSKIEAGRFELFDVDFDPREVIAEVTHLFREPCASKGLEFVYFVAEEVPAQLRGDPVRLRQVLINLIGNAIKYTQRGEILVDVSIAATGPDTVTLACAVEDTGIGIEASQIPKVFDSFYQADRQMSRAQGGSGLGLTIVKHIVEMMGGEIGVESEIGKGSRFRFTMRVRPSASERAPARITRHIARPQRVLLVDANSVSARVLSLYLSTWRIDAVVRSGADDAEAAWNTAIAAERPFDVAIVDVMGLGAAGYDLIKKIRSDKRHEPAEVVALVAIDSFVADDSLERLGVAAMLMKPMRPSDLFNCLAALASGGRDRGMSRAGKHTPRVDRPQFGARVLVVEDNAINQEVAVGMLEVLGCSTMTAPNGNDAVDLFRRESFDLILMDCEMPVMDGFEAARHIREVERSLNRTGEAPRRTAIIAVTAHALAEVRAQCLAAGMDDFLIKPFDEQQMIETLRRWLRPQGRAAAEQRIPVEPPSAHASAIDLATIEQLRAIKGKEGNSLLQRVIAQFASVAPPLAAIIRAKAGDGDAEAVWRAAHSLKSSAAAVGARQLSQRCSEIEAAARAAGTESVHRLLDALDQELVVATQSLRELT